MISGYKSYLKVRVFSACTVITKETKEPNNRVLLGALLFGCIVSLVVRNLCLGTGLQKESKIKYIPSSVSLLHVLDFPPVSAGHSSKWLKYLNEKKSKCKTKVYKLNVTLILLKHVKWENSRSNFLHVLILGHPSA